jgi:hypothetical protein
VEKNSIKIGITVTGFLGILVALSFLFEEHSAIYHLINIAKAGHWDILLSLVEWFLLIVISVGLLRLSNFGRKCFIVLAFYFLICTVWGSFVVINMMSKGDVPANMWPIIYSPQYFFASIFFIGAIVYLTRPDIKAQFK